MSLSVLALPSGAGSGSLSLGCIGLSKQSVSRLLALFSAAQRCTLEKAYPQQLWFRIEPNSIETNPRLNLSASALPCHKRLERKASGCRPYLSTRFDFRRTSSGRFRPSFLCPLELAFSGTSYACRGCSFLELPYQLVMQTAASGK
jgi:hypothetical protein